MTAEKVSSCNTQGSCAQSDTTNPTAPSAQSGVVLDQFALQEQHIARTLSHIKDVIFVMSGKGGVGKSSVAVNTAVALAKRGKKVGLLDIDLHGPSVPRLLNLESSIEYDEATAKLLPAVYTDAGMYVLSMDLLLQDRDTAIVWRGPKKTAAIRQFLSDVAWGSLDYLVIDSPPGTGDEHLTLLKAIPQARCLVVTTPQAISLADVRKAMNFLQTAEASVVGIVENMSGLHCPHCEQEITLFAKGTGEKLAQQYGVPFLGAIPLDPATVAAAEQGRPVVLLEEPTPAQKAFFALAEAVDKTCVSQEYVQLNKAEEK